MAFYYTYVLECSDGEWYVGSTEDIERRKLEHDKGAVKSTKDRLPVEVIYYEACRSVAAARTREKQLKSGFGRGYLNRRLKYERTST